MDDRIMAAAQGALRRLASGSPGSGAKKCAPADDALLLDRLTLAQLSNLAYLQAEDPLVQKVLDALRSGRPVYLDRPALEKALALASFPPRVQEQFARWFSRISGYGVQITGEPDPVRAVPPVPPLLTPDSPKASTPDAGLPQSALPPERQVLAEILGQSCAAESPCFLEPKKSCCGSGRCKSLGF